MAMQRVTETVDSVTAVGYVRVSTAEQAASGAGLVAQQRAIRQACKARGWTLIAIHEDAEASGRDLMRPGLLQAIEDLDAGTAGVLVVSKLDRLSRSLLDFAGLMERSRRQGWGLAALDVGVDTSTPQGEMMANVMATFAQFERRLIGLRTKEALQVRRAEGVRLGRPPVVSEETVSRIGSLSEAGLSLRGIGQQLEREGVPAPRGGSRWHPNTVRRLISRASRTGVMSGGRQGGGMGSNRGYSSKAARSRKSVNQA